MNIMVCVKQTFDTEENIELDEGRILENGVKFIMNPYDEYAVEEALKQREKAGGNVTVIAVGPDRSENVLRTALAMGADQAVHICDDLLDQADEYVISQVLAEVIRKNPFDLILTGYMSIDNGAAQGGPRLAELLDIPHIATVVNLEIKGDQVIVERDVEGDIEVVGAQLPLLITTQQGLNEPRYPSLPGIMKAKKKPLERLDCSELGINSEQLISRTQLIHQMLPPPRNAGRLLKGGAVEAVQELIDLLRSEEKVI